MSIRIVTPLLKQGGGPILSLEPEENWPSGSLNINIDVFRVDELRDEFVWWSGQTFDLTRSLQITLPNWPQLSPGIYKIVSVRAIPDEFSAPIELLSEQLHFVVFDEGQDQPITLASLPAEIERVYLNRRAAIMTPIITPAAVLRTSPVEMVGLAFGEGPQSILPSTCEGGHSSHMVKVWDMKICDQR